MTTKIIGIKEFRKNITSLWKEARKKNIRYIVMYHSKPVMDARPIKEDQLILEQFTKELKEAEKQADKGEVYSQEEVKKILGIK